MRCVGDIALIANPGRSLGTKCHSVLPGTSNAKAARVFSSGERADKKFSAAVAIAAAGPEAPRATTRRGDTATTATAATTAAAHANEPRRQYTDEIRIRGLNGLLRARSTSQSWSAAAGVGHRTQAPQLWRSHRDNISMNAWEWMKLSSRELLWPSRCAACDAFVAPNDAFCSACEPSITALEQACPRCAMPQPASSSCERCLRQPWPFSSVKAAVLYGGAVSDALVRFKHGRQDLVHALAPLIWAGLAATPHLHGSLLVPVPLHPVRLRRRGFNQAFDLAKEAVKRAQHGTGVAVAPLCLRRLSDGLHLPHESVAARHQRAQGAFAVAQARRVVGRRIVLIDDVLTTGATSCACAQALLKAGAASVSLVVAARTI